MKQRFQFYLLGSFWVVAGSASTEALLPLIAVSTLKASPQWVTILTAVTLGLSLVLRFPLAKIVDRSANHGRIAILASAASASWTLVVPICYVLGILSLPILLLWNVINIAILTLQSCLGYGIVNLLSSVDDRVRNVGRVSSARSMADVGAQSLSPALLAVAAAPYSLVIDTLCNAAGIAYWLRSGLWRGRREERDLQVDSGGASSTERVFTSFREICSYLASDHLLWIAGTSALSSAISAPIIAYYLINSRQLAPAIVGSLMAAGAVGATAGGAMIGRLADIYSARSIVCSGALIMAASMVALALLPGSRVLEILFIVIIEFGTGFGGTMVMALVFGELQAKLSIESASRVMSSASIFVEALGVAGLGLSFLLQSLSGNIVLLFWVSAGTFSIVGLLGASGGIMRKA